MSAVPATIKAPAEPQVNLLPPEVLARRAQGRTRGLIGLGFGLFLVLMGVAVYLAWGQNSVAQRELQKEVETGNSLQAKVDSYQWVLNLKAELDGASSAQTFVGSTEILWTDLVFQTAAAIPPDAILDTVVWKPGNFAGFPAPGEEPFDRPDVGTMEFSGRLASYVSGADLEEAINSVPGFARARVSTEERQNEAGFVFYTFDGTAHMTGLAFSGRFSPEWMLTDHRTQARDELNQKLEAAEAEELAAQIASTYDVPNDDPAVVEATAAVEAAKADADQYAAILGVVIGAETSVHDLQDAVDAGTDGAAQALATAQAKQDELRPILATLVEAVRVWYEAAQNEAYIGTRIAAAEQLVKSAQDKVDLLQGQVTEETATADDLRDAESDLAYAESNLAEEQSYLSAAQEATLETRGAVDDALAAAELVAPVTGSSADGGNS